MYNCLLLLIAVKESVAVIVGIFAALISTVTLYKLGKFPSFPSVCRVLNGNGH